MRHINLRSPKSSVIAIPRCELIRKKIVHDALKTHSKLLEDDIKFGVDTIVNCSKENILSDEELASIVLHMYKGSNTGRFCLTFNLDIDMHLRSRDKERIKMLTKAPKEAAFPELYQNDLLTQGEKDTINRMYNKEYYAILNTIEKSKFCDTPLLPCHQEKDEYIFQDNSNLSIYNQCYKDICIQESMESTPCLSGSCNIPQKTYVADCSSGENKAYCFDMIDLIKRLGSNNLNNPKTHKPFSDRAKCQLINKYMKEIKMYRKYLCNLRNLGLIE